MPLNTNPSNIPYRDIIRQQKSIQQSQFPRDQQSQMPRPQMSQAPPNQQTSPSNPMMPQMPQQTMSSLQPQSSTPTVNTNPTGYSQTSTPNSSINPWQAGMDWAQQQGKPMTQKFGNYNTNYNPSADINNDAYWNAQKQKYGADNPYAQKPKSIESLYGQPAGYTMPGNKNWR